MTSAADKKALLSESFKMLTGNNYQQYHNEAAAENRPIRDEAVLLENSNCSNKQDVTDVQKSKESKDTTSTTQTDHEPTLPPPPFAFDWWDYHGGCRRARGGRGVGYVPYSTRRGPPPMYHGPDGSLYPMDYGYDYDQQSQWSNVAVHGARRKGKDKKTKKHPKTAVDTATADDAVAEQPTDVPTSPVWNAEPSPHMDNSAWWGQMPAAVQQWPAWFMTPPPPPPMLHVMLHRAPPMRRMAVGKSNQRQQPVQQQPVQQQPELIRSQSGIGEKQVILRFPRDLAIVAPPEIPVTRFFASHNKKTARKWKHFSDARAETTREKEVLDALRKDPKIACLVACPEDSDDEPLEPEAETDGESDSDDDDDEDPDDLFQGADFACGEDRQQVDKLLAGLLQSWYYAGYYTGLKKAAESAKKEKEVTEEKVETDN
eukprot:CAMPEP_0113847130 /NCGR_PEP_ID=MMETSP0372-20130328/1698_1 /TAXON_ID=340204 /ORGANISM="Lankesteria abbotti" /LENGTH=428 /DNA_ID=CAMNT_0000816363 /DNA_START=70 /DNA_END=1356 /DNA_ORIENTATION=+ /assembly_acc=CAM_ASM_000359